MTQAVEDKIWVELAEELAELENIKVEFPKDSKSKSLDLFWKMFLEERFPEGRINTALEKNFAVYIVQNELDINTIKAKYIAQGWSPQALLGWIKKVRAGEIVNFNVGEIVNWCKEFKPELAGEFVKEEAHQDLNFELIWEKDLKDHKQRENEWLIEDFVPAKSVGVLTGKRSTLKTFEALLMGICVSRGGDFLGTYPTKKKRVLVLDKENGVPIIQKRIQMLKNGLNLGDENLEMGFICFSQLKLDKNLDVWEIEETIKREGIGLLIVDTYRRAISFDENSAGDVSKLFVDTLRPIVEKHDCSILLIHHDKKGNEGDEMDNIRGSSDLANYSDFILKSVRRGKNLVLKQLKCRNAPEIKPQKLGYETDEETFFKFNVVEDEVSQTIDERCAEILLNWIKEKEIKTFKTKEAQKIATDEGIGRSVFFRTLTSLAEEGYIHSRKRGIWEVCDEK